MKLSLTDLSLLNPEQLTYAANGLVAAQKGLADGQSELTGGRPPASWVGESGAAARDGHQRLQNSLNDMMAPVRVVVRELDTCAANLTAAQDTLSSAIESATSHNWTIVAPNADSVSLDTSMDTAYNPAFDMIIGQVIIGHVQTALRDADAALEELRLVLVDARKDRIDGGTGTVGQAGPRRLPPDLRTLTDEELATKLAELVKENPDDFGKYFGLLSPAQRSLYYQAFFDGFDPSKEITPGDLPDWADPSCNQWTKPGDGPLATVSGTYGYTGGGTITGPDGEQWPIVMPYLDKNGVRYMEDVGDPRADGGLKQLDGRDPGWTTVTTYQGLHHYQSISKMMGLWGGINGLAGNRVYPDALYIDANGQPSLKAPLPGEGPTLTGPAATRDTWIPDAQDVRAGNSGRLVNETGVGAWNGIAGRANLAMMSLEVVNTIDAVGTHEERPYQVEYEVNEDGRKRAIIHTYQAGLKDDGTPVVGSFANYYQDGEHTEEISYAKRVNGDYSPPDGVEDVNLEGTSSQRHVDLDIDAFGG